MTFLPIQEKPNQTNSNPFILEVDNIIPESLADELINYGYINERWIRMKAKSRGVTGSFSTYMLMDLQHKVYQHITSIWQEFSISYPNIILSMIEPCEIKAYKIGDYFGNHNDIQSIYNETIRKVNLSIQLSDADDYEGGSLGISGFKSPNYAKRTKCTGIFFLARNTHWITEVTRGTRYCLISHTWGPDII